MSDLSPDFSSPATAERAADVELDFGRFWVTRLFEGAEVRASIGRLVVATRYLPGIEIRGDEALPDGVQPGVKLLKSNEGHPATRPLRKIARDLRITVPTLQSEMPIVFDDLGDMSGRSQDQEHPEMFIMLFPATKYLAGLTTERLNIFNNIEGVDVQSRAEKRQLDLTIAYLPPGTEPELVAEAKAIVAAQLPLRGVLLPATMPGLPE